MVNHPNRAKRKPAAISGMRVAQRPRRPAHDHEADYHALLRAVTRTFARSDDGAPLFQTDAADLFNLFLRGLPAEKQVHTCSACRHFVERYGGLVGITPEGVTLSAMWAPSMVPEFYRPAVAAMAKVVERANVTGPFLSSDRIWGQPRTGDWTHLSVVSERVHDSRVFTAGQAMAAKREDFKTVERALERYTPNVISEALRLLRAETLVRSERFIAPLVWLEMLHKNRDLPNRRRRDNVLWLRVATAPDGYCHPASSVTGTLLEDIANGLPFADIKARWADKMHPLQYQRPQAAPKAQNIANAEKIIEKLGAQRSLERRFARFDDLQLEWAPSWDNSAPRAGTGVFAHVRAREAVERRPARTADAGPITWEKFARTVLPEAQRIEAYMAHANMGFIALTTAQNWDAPRIIKWDRDGERNPVAWYVYHGGSRAEQWNLRSGDWVDVTGIAPLPTMWGAKPSPHLGEGAVLVLKGCVDQRAGSGNALFPEFLINELLPARATIEAYSRTAEFHGRAEAGACGLDIRKGAQMRVRLRVNGSMLYDIDRWD